MPDEDLCSQPPILTTELRVPAFWWDGQPNFGDALTKFVLSTVDIRAEWCLPKDAAIIGIGSVLEHVPEDTTAIIFGTGFQFASSRKCFPRARIAAMRGKHSATNAGIDPKEVLLGDPGILFDRVNVPSEYRVGIVPHYVDCEDPRLSKLEQRCGNDLQLIDVRTNDAALVRDKIATCGCVLSSSLHGLVVALGLGKPVCWIELSDRVLGKGFKFHDFYSAFELDASPKTLTGHENATELETMCAEPPALVSTRKDALLSSLQRLYESLYGELH